MSADDSPEGPDESDRDVDEQPADPADEPPGEEQAREELTQRLSQETDRAVEGFDQGLIDLLSWMLDTETRARIYVYLRQHPHATSEEIAEGTGLYPSTVREALAELHEEDVVERRKRENEGAGNNPYEYAAIAPSELVGSVAEQVQNELNTVFNLDRYLGSEETDIETDSEPVTITVEESDVDDGEGERIDIEGATDETADDGPASDDDADATVADGADAAENGDTRLEGDDDTDPVSDDDHSGE